MCVTAIARRRRRQCKMDKRYKKASLSKSLRRSFLASKAAKEGRSFGYSKK